MKESVTSLKKIKIGLYQSKKPKSTQSLQRSNKRKQPDAFNRRNAHFPALGREYQRYFDQKLPKRNDTYQRVNKEPNEFFHTWEGLR